MEFKNSLLYFGLRQTIGESAETLVNFLKKHFKDPSQTMPKALQTANEKSWQALEIAIAGDLLLNRLWNIATPTQIKAFSHQVEKILHQKGETFRKQCLRELKRTKKQGLLSTISLETNVLVREMTHFKRFHDPHSLIEESWEVMSQTAVGFREKGFNSLAELLSYQTAGEAPLWLIAFGYFLRQEIIADSELADELLFDQLRQIDKEQRAGFAELQQVMKKMGIQFQIILDEVVDSLTVFVEEVTDVKKNVQDLKEIQRTQGINIDAKLNQVIKLLGKEEQRDEINPISNFPIHPEKSLKRKSKKIKVDLLFDGDDKLFTINLPNLPKKAEPIEMVLIPAGKFLMGSPDNEKDRIPNEGPQHEVTLTKKFYIGKFPITQAQWQAVMGKNPSEDYGIGLNHPVYYVSHENCLIFLTKFNQLSKKTFRLPSEAEWEYTCRAGTTTRFYWGDDPDYMEIGKYVWYCENSNSQTHAVGEKEPNKWGLYDMCGNVWEWCRDRKDNYSKSPQIDPVGSHFGSEYVIRGGGWDCFAKRCRSAYRYGYIERVTSNSIGFRLLLEVQ